MENTTTAAEVQHCVNCGAEVSGKYCSNCGQRNNMPRYTLRIIIDNFFSNIFSFERGFWLTLKTLIVSPSTVIEAYLAGNTVRYFHPMKLFIFLSFINTFLIIQFGFFDQSVEVSIQDMENNQMDNIELQRNIMKYIKKFMNVLNLINIPFYSLSSYFLYRKKKLNYAEHTIINTYALAIYVGLSILFSLSLFVFPEFIVHYSMALIALSWAIYVYTFKSYFQDSWIKTIFKTILITAMSFFFIVLTGMIIVIIVALILGPEVLKQQ